MTDTAKWMRMVGDLNFDNSTDAADLVLLQQHMLGIAPSNADFDVNDDGVVDAADAVIIQMKILGIN